MYLTTVHAGGGHKGQNKNLDDILRYNSTRDEWKNVGKMTEPRWYHAVGLIDDVSRICAHGYIGMWGV